MDMMLGSGLLIAAVGLLGLARLVVARSEGSARVRMLAQSEAMALLITIAAAFGVSFLAAGLASDHSTAGWIKFAAAMGLVVLSIIGIVWATRRSLATEVGAKGTGSRAAPRTPSAPSA